MRAQWEEFLSKNDSLWSYNVVPRLVERIDKNPNDSEAIEMLAWQGITITDNGELEFIMDFKIDGVHLIIG